jgi:hypothetical protein
MDIRTCRSCKYYEISPIRRMGWCCHPRLVPPQHRHLVWEDELDCDRGLYDYWEAREPGPLSATSAAGQHASEGMRPRQGVQQE